ncbi:hypothetical protein [Thermococcus sp.]|uniref:hypothetical protein n=1 Tax=Thermococcus sp. TaxID=35749 RepID=UPI002606BD71|nr:hypothetical protein [Thermococcus sp.]
MPEVVEVKPGRLFLVVVLVLLVMATGCISQGTGTSTSHASPAKTSHTTPPSGTGPSQTTTETGETSTRIVQHPTGVQTYRLLNRTVAINASLVPDSVWECSDKAPSVIEGYYSAVKNEENISGFFDLSVVDESSLVELHEALYEAVDFKDLKVENLECFPVSTKLVACKYHYSAVIVKDSREMGIERDYVTFLSGDRCKIVWTEVEG